MGINDFCFTSNENEIITCSSDRTAKVWKVDFEGNKLDEVRTLVLSEADSEEFKENVDKQILGAIYSKEAQNILAVTHNSDLQVWSEEANTPVKTIRGHNSQINKVVLWKN